MASSSSLPATPYTADVAVIGGGGGGWAAALALAEAGRRVVTLLNDSDAVCLVAQDQEQVDKGLAILDRVPHLRQLIYWDDTGMWSYHHPRLTPFEVTVTCE